MTGESNRLHAPHRSLSWLLQNISRPFKLLWRRGTGQFSRAGNALLPYYQRFVPMRIKAMVPDGLQDAVAEWLAKQPEDMQFEWMGQEREDHAGWLYENVSNSAIVRIPGTRVKNLNSPTILVCAHDSRKQLYGAERSFLDLLDGFAATLCNVVVVIPRTGNAAYIHELTARSTEVVSFHYTWWRAKKPIDQSLVAVFEALVDLHQVSVVHVNTIMLREPLIAARRKKVPAVVHAREIITDDPALCEAIGADANSIVKEVVANADYIIANSKATAACYDKGDHTIVLPNTIDIDEFDIQNDVDDSQIHVGLISSNIVKKGIFDFAELAERLKDRAPNLRFVLIGPQNQHTSAILRAQKRRGLYSNLIITGYVQRPVDAVSKVNIVVNLSHFSESFGRTVLEAMAGRRPVVAYNWGAIPELMIHGETGYLVPHKDIDQVALYLERLALDPSLITKMGEAARKIAVSGYSKQKFAESLQKSYSKILGESPGKTRQDLQSFRSH